MGEKKVSGIRKDLSLSEISEKIDSVTPKSQKRNSKFKSFFSNLGEILSSLGLFPVLNTSSNSKKDKAYKSPDEEYRSSREAFKEDYKSNISQRTDLNPEKAYTAREQEEAYLQSAGFTRDDLILTEEEYLKRKQEEAYLDSLPGYKKTDRQDGER